MFRSLLGLFHEKRNREGKIAETFLRIAEEMNYIFQRVKVIEFWSLISRCSTYTFPSRGEMRVDEKIKDWYLVIQRLSFIFPSSNWFDLSNRQFLNRRAISDEISLSLSFPRSDNGLFCAITFNFLGNSIWYFSLCTVNMTSLPQSTSKKLFIEEVTDEGWKEREKEATTTTFLIQFSAVH